MRMCVKAVLIAAVVLVGGVCSAQQNPAYYQTGLPVNAAQVPIPLGAVNALTGNVHLEIPLASIPERNGIPFVAKLTYNAIPAPIINPNGGGWTPFTYGTEGWRSWVTWDFSTLPCQNLAYPNGSNGKTTNFRVVDDSGAAHVVPGAAIRL